MTFDADRGPRSIYQEVEECESALNKALKEHAFSRERLQRATVQFDHMKRWATKINKSMQGFEDPIPIDSQDELYAYFVQFQGTVDRFLQHIQNQLAGGKAQKKSIPQAQAKEYHEQARLLNDKEFLKSNCRIAVGPDHGMRSDTYEEDYDPGAMISEREAFKNNSTVKVNDALRRSAKDKKQRRKE